MNKKINKMKRQSIGKVIYKRSKNSKNCVYLIEDGTYLIQHYMLLPIDSECDTIFKTLKTFKDNKLVRSEYLLSKQSVQVLTAINTNIDDYKYKLVKIHL